MHHQPTPNCFHFVDTKIRSTIYNSIQSAKSTMLSPHLSSLIVGFRSFSLYMFGVSCCFIFSIQSTIPHDRQHYIYSDHNEPPFVNPMNVTWLGVYSRQPQLNLRYLSYNIKMLRLSQEQDGRRKNRTLIDFDLSVLKIQY